MRKIIHCIIASLFIYSTSRAQAKPEFNNIVFEGAGIRGIAYCGALKELESRGLMSNVQKIAGTSAGALMAMTISLGYNSDELSQIISQTNFKEFNDGKYFFIGGINRMNKWFGWYRIGKVDKWLGQLIEAKTGNADITFAELHSRNFKDLYITGTCLNKQKLVVFSYETYPKMRIRDAVKISMSIPLYFEAVFMDEDGKLVKHPSRKDNLDIMVDGGFTGNFPIHVFDSMADSFPNTYVPRINYHTLGLRIDSDNQIKKDSVGKELAELPIRNMKTYLGAFYNIVIENLNRQTLTSDDWARTVSISDGGVGPRLRRLSKAEIDILIENGRVAMNNHLKQL
jgi:NTE family protein